jgi:hypothetical protein
MKSYQIENCNTIANHYGKDSQVLIAIEEMSELTKELCKYFRRYDRKNEIIEEIADAEIMIEQLKCLFDIHTEVSNEIDYKLERQIRRMEQERGD